jgi:cellulose synthase/poly-beta-1,6-N-acetylglucosamine synthase-like glycosyltransferase
VTEDYNTAMHLMAAGFSSMYLNERLVFGMVPEDIPGGRGGPRWPDGLLDCWCWGG